MTRTKTFPESEKIFFEAIGLLSRRGLLPVVTPERVEIGDIVTHLQGRWRVIKAEWSGHEVPAITVKIHETGGQMDNQYGRMWKITEIVLSWYSSKMNDKGIRRSLTIGTGVRHDNAAENFLLLLDHGPGGPPRGPIWGWHA